MKMVIIQHEYYEKASLIEKWAIENHITTRICNIFNNDTLPDINELDILVLMGGPMNVYEEEKYNWLKDEKKFIEETIKKEKKIIGICLGAQLISTVLGYKVTKNRYKEIGFYKIFFEKDFLEKYSKIIPKSILESGELTTFHWHGDTFETPPNSIKIAKSKACENQGYILNNIIALQFHPEVTYEDIAFFLSIENPEITENDKYIQSKEEILNIDKKYHLKTNKDFLYSLLNYHILR